MLERRVSSTEDVEERVALLMRLGSLQETALDREDVAVAVYRRALDKIGAHAEAIKALGEAAKSGKNDELIQADKWLEMQGLAALEPLADVVTDEEAHLAPRIAACRVLRRLGPNAKPALKQALGSESQQMRLNAIESLSLVRPSDQDIIETLMDLVDGEDERTRLQAVLALSRIGPQAKDTCGDKLVTILNDEEENDTIRDAAKRALKKVNPRRTFTD